jgi:hydroxymethylpyrimidine kinase/phosphomethylpyrimidine kinase/thiamine-phosphate diphosphorylase
MSIKPPVVWCVGGSDSSAHTGLPSDIRTGQNLGCHVQSIMTATRVQNSQDGYLLEPISLSKFNEQWQTLLDDLPPDAIKVGLLPSAEIVKACSTWLERLKADYPNVLVVFDPVMVSGSDRHNLEKADFGADLLAPLLPYVDVITSNLLDIEALTGLSGKQPITDLKTQLAAYFYASPCRWLMKGDHSETGKTTDWLVNQTGIVGFSSDTLARQNASGKGGTLTMALASFIAHGYDVLDAMTMAKAYLNAALKSAVKIDQKTEQFGLPGWPLQIENLPIIVTPHQYSNVPHLSFAKMDLNKMGLYPVVDTIAWLTLVLKQGIKLAQLRIKNPDDPELEGKIQQAIALGQKYNAQVFINDYWQQAITFGAYGVHLGQEDLDVADLSAIQDAGLRLGISTHGYYEIARAQSIKPSYIALGHIFPTQTKDMPSQPQGVKRLAHYACLLKGHYPTVAIGGIDAERLPLVARTGVTSVALVTAITKADDPEAATRSLMASLLQHEGGRLNEHYAE